MTDLHRRWSGPHEISANAADKGEEVQGGKATFSLASLLLFTTFLCVAMGAFALHWIAGIIFTVIATPAIIRTALWARKWRRRGRPRSFLAKVEDFVQSLVIFAMLAVIAVCAFFLAMFDGMVAGPFGGICGLFAAVYLTFGWGRELLERRVIPNLTHCPVCGVRMDDNAVCLACEPNRWMHRMARETDPVGQGPRP